MLIKYTDGYRITRDFQRSSIVYPEVAYIQARDLFSWY